MLNLVRDIQAKCFSLSKRLSLRASAGCGWPVIVRLHFLARASFSLNNMMSCFGGFSGDTLALIIQSVGHVLMASSFWSIHYIKKGRELNSFFTEKLLICVDECHTLAPLVSSPPPASDGKQVVEKWVETLQKAGGASSSLSLSFSANSISRWI